MKKQRYSLVSIIYNDLYYYGRWQLFLLSLVLISAMLIILVTYKARSIIIDREEIILEKNALDAEWRNLILEEKILSHHSRIERIAIDKLKMCYTDLMMEDNTFR